MNKRAVYLMMLISSLFILAVNHLGQSLGDWLFYSLGTSPWTQKNESGLHLPVLFGLIMLIAGAAGTVKYYRSKYPTVRSRIFIGCIAFFIIYPWATEKLMFVFKYNSYGIHSLAYDKKNSYCSFNTEDELVKANCILSFYNYGKLSNVDVSPIFHEPLDDLNFESQVVYLPPNTKIVIHSQFNSVKGNGVIYSGRSSAIDIKMTKINEG